MSIKSIITSAVLIGTSSAAFASPAPIQDNCDPVTVTSPAAWQPGQRDPGYRPEYARRQVVLGGGRHRFTEDGRKLISVGSQLGRFRALEINAAAGGVFIKQVYVQFENGQEQVIRDVNATLRGTEGIKLDLDGGARAIRRVVVYGNDLRRGWNRRNSTFTVTAV